MTESPKDGQSQPPSTAAASSKAPTEQPALPPQRVLRKQEKRAVVLLREHKVGVLRFSPKAWAKFIWFRNRGQTEIAGFGLSQLDDPLYVVDFVTVLQEASGATFEFDDDALNNYLSDMVDEGYQPAECMRIWLHTHPPGVKAPRPSGHDEEVFKRCFGKCDWSVMCILGDDGNAYARLYISAAKGEIGMSCELKVMRDYTGSFDGVTPAEVEKWEDEYVKNVHAINWIGRDGALGLDYAWQATQPHGWSLDDGDRRVDEHFGATVLDDLLGDEEIIQISDRPEETTVYLRDFWASYPLGTHFKVIEGAFVHTLRDIADELPKLWGELMWDGEDVATPIVTSVFVDDHFVQTNNEAMAIDDVVEDAMVVEEGGAADGPSGP